MESDVAQLVVRDIEEDVKIGLRRRAKRHGRSMEAEVREILRDARACWHASPASG
jgi:plasmid stability protein